MELQIAFAALLRRVPILSLVRETGAWTPTYVRRGLQALHERVSAVR